MTYQQKMAELDARIELADARAKAAFGVWREHLEVKRKLEEERLKLLQPVDSTPEEQAREHGQGAIPQEEQPRVDTKPIGPIDPQKT